MQFLSQVSHCAVWDVQEACSEVDRACQTRAVIEISNPDEDLERITEGSMWGVTDLAAPDMHRGTLLLRATARSHWQPLDANTEPQMCALISINSHISDPSIQCAVSFIAGQV